ncbi:MAG: hypothetical protein CVU97_00600 [Firmicutes bacterium HGW-Firmicutes-21]|nr:MAG: hypothetical protein CVU97_00600 [Firmicutes bacterium HGW-Firmicutes-21]
MKNKDCIKKSIQENIVDHTAVLNNLKARASSAGSGKAAGNRAAYFGYKRAVIAVMLMAIIGAGAVGAAHLFDSGNGIFPPQDISGYPNDNTGSAGNNSSSYDQYNSITSPDEYSQTDNSCESESREPHSGDESGGIITSDPLDPITAEFFADFAGKYITYRQLIGTLLEYQYNYNLNYNSLSPYCLVTNERFRSLSEIESFLYDMMVPVLAADIYASLALVDNPKYIERNGELYMDTTSAGSRAPSVNTASAYFVSNKTDKMAIAVMLSCCEEGQDYYTTFHFTRVNGRWLLDTKPG